MPKHYTSTYCFHREHADCRLTCKVCSSPCRCECHAPVDSGRLHVHCARCGTWTAAVRSRSLANNEMDVCPECEADIEADT